MQSPLFDWAYNPTFLSGFLAWMSAGVTKMICFFVRTRQIRPSFLFSTGGMPSAHSSMAGALVTSVAIREGMHTTLFAVTLAFSLVVMFDAQSVRQAAGMQARILNQIIDQLFKERRFSEQKLAELLGHTRLEVLMGMMMGVMVAFLVHAVQLFRTAA
ncbi:MAG: divergent PAP2 family protein [Lentisphaerae bacterium]|nr:divergent PAP2 family protein [Lentisphaerota bacterium]